MRRILLTGLLVPLLMLAACTSADYIAAVNLIVSSAEIVLSTIPATAAVAPLADAFATDGETIVDNLITCGTTAPCIATATAALGALVVPVVPAQYQSAVTAEANAISAFISAWGSSSASAARYAKAVREHRAPPVKFSKGGQAKLFALHQRIQDDLAKWKH